MKNFMHKLLFFSLLLLICSSCSTSQSKSVKHSFNLDKILSKIPLCDQEKLETLFHHMMTGDYFACTLFGNKPMTFQEFHDDPWKMSSYCMVCPYYYHYMDEGWKTWTKYRSFFPSSKFIFAKIPSKVGYEFIILINKEAFRKMFDANKDIFEQGFGPQVTVEQVLHDFEEGQKPFSQVLNEHEGLVGLVLGYGRKGSLSVFMDAALRFQIMRKSLHPLAPPCEHEKLASKAARNTVKLREKTLFHKGVKWHQLNYFQIADVEDPYEVLNKNKEKEVIFGPAWQERIVDILPPNFFSIKGSEELARLRQEYGETMQTAREIFKTKSFLIGFLEQYCKQR